MTCPDNLLIGMRKGTLTAEERERLDSHVEQCSSCRLALAVGQDFDAVLETSSGDELIAARIARGPARREVGSGGLAGRRARRLSSVAIAALGVVAGAGLAAAAIGGWTLRTANVAPPATVQTPAPARAPATAQPAAPETSAAPDTPAIEQRDEAPVGQAAPSAAELFANANASRSEGQARRALSLYGELQRRYPASAEAEVSHVSLGRVMLDLGQTSGALTQFDRYLSRKPGGPLAQEALFGKASALARLGRLDDERRTWETLLARFPKSIYRDRANERLGQPR
jgi:TolA-binding protein